MSPRTSTDVGALLAVLDEHGVEYVIAGSVGTAAHGVEGIDPADLDVVPATDDANLRRLATALENLGAEPSVERGEWRRDDDGEWAWVEDGIERPPRPLDPSAPATFDHAFATVHGTLDIVPEVAGTHDDLRRRAHRRRIAGAEHWVAHPVDLLAGMTRPRRTKDGLRVLQLRAVATSAATMPASGIGFVGFRTDRFDAMVALFRDRIGLSIIRQAPSATWFGLGSHGELHVYAESDPDHAFFTTGPVVGLRVDDVNATRAALEADGLEMLTEIERTETAAWCHFRAPDGTVLEIIGPPGAVLSLD